MPHSLVRAADRLLSLVVHAAAIASGTSIFLMAVLMAANVVSRQVFDKPFLDSVLLGELSVVIMTFMGMAWVYRLGRHVAVRFLVDLLPWKARTWIEVVGLTLSLVALGIAVYETWIFAYASLQMGERLRGIFRVDAFPFHVLMPIGLGLLSLEVARAVALDVAALVAGRPELAARSMDSDAG